MLVENMDWRIRKCRFIAANDFRAEATTATFNLPLPSPGGYIMDIQGRVVTAFTGITGPIRVKIGFAGSTEHIMADQTIDTAGVLFPSDKGMYHNFFCARRTMLYGMPQIIITFTSDSGNLSDMTAGEVEFLVFYVN